MTSYSRHSATDVEQACMSYLAAHEQWVKGYIASLKEEEAKIRAAKKAELEGTLVGVLWWKRPMNEEEVGRALDDFLVRGLDWSLCGTSVAKQVRSLLTQAKAAHGNSHMLLSTEDANLLHEYL